MKLSFIVPAYNTSQTIGRTIDSIIEQDESSIEYEIIVVNDGSPDNLDEVMQKYKNKVKYYKKSNGGLSDARNYGVQKAKGEYYIFVDSDDYISKSLLKDIEKYINQGADLIKWEPIIVDNEGKTINKCSTNSFIQASGEECFNRLYGTDPLMVCVWNYAIKKDVLLEFPKGRYHEDFAIIPLMILKSKNMIITEKNEYYYVQTESSIMRGNDNQKQRRRIEDILYHFDKLIEESQKMNISKTAKDNLGIFCVNSLLVNIPELSGQNNDYFSKELRKRKISKYIKIRNLKQLVKKIILAVKY